VQEMIGISVRDQCARLLTVHRRDLRAHQATRGKPTAPGKRGKK